MTKHMRLVVSVLFIVIIVLAVAITRFYSNANPATELSGTQPAVAKKLEPAHAGNHIFTDSAGHYGMIDSNERVIVYPEWQEIEFTDSDLCIASKQMRGKKLMGCIDYEGNISVPFVYSQIEALKFPARTLYAARSADNNTYVIYDQNFNPCFSNPWTSYEKYDTEDKENIINKKSSDKSTDKNELILKTQKGEYSYTVTAGDLILRNASVNCKAMDCSCNIEVTNKYLLSDLSVSTLEKMSNAVEKYLEYAFTGDSSLLSDIGAEPSAVFLTLFPQDHSVISKKLMKLSELSVYNATSDDGISHYKVYITANISANYKGADKKAQYSRADYKAVVEFTYAPEKGLRVISGNFIPNELSYPIKAAESKQPAEANSDQQAH